MDDAPDIARIAALLADPARARILRMLVDGTTRPAGELAYAANISAQSANRHLARLVEGRLLTAEPHGRHRYFRIATREVADMIERIASLDAASTPRKPPAQRVPDGAPVQFLHARTCYGHLAGETAVRILQAMLKVGWLESAGRDYALNAAGRKALLEIGVAPAWLVADRRVFARACVDLTQRRPHLGGGLGEALLDAYVERGWIQRQRRSRAVNITPTGHEGFRRAFRI
jgi:DNA-binding transcriptional ArsR family regulator